MGALTSLSLWKTVAVGAVAGLLGWAAGEPIMGLGGSERQFTSMSQMISHALASSSAWVAIIGLVLGVALLAWENVSSLRGKWFRDLGPGIPLFLFLGLASGASAQILYSVGMAFVAVGGGGEGGAPQGGTLVAASLIRGLGWALFGAGVGASIGILRGDQGQLGRGALGGAIGGFLGGALFNFVGASLGAGAPDYLPRLIGVVLLGIFLGGATRLVQETLKSAWLLGISTGPYEGKEYPLGKARLTVGRGGNCDLSLFKDESLAPQVGALVFESGTWFWQGEPILINGQLQTNSPLLPGSRLQIGATTFRFNDRSKTAPRDALGAPIFLPQPPTGIASGAHAAPVPTPDPAPAAPAPLVWTFSPAIGNTLTGFRLSLETGTATIGRAEGNTWQLKDDGTSSRHARLERTRDGLALTDLNSTNGTYINGQKMAPNVPVALGGGETIRFGRTQWMVRRGG